MPKNINCEYNDRGAWCKDVRVKRSLLGMGARCCLVFDNKDCPYQIEYELPDAPPTPPPPPKNRDEWTNKP